MRINPLSAYDIIIEINEDQPVVRITETADRVIISVFDTDKAWWKKIHTITKI